jgi:large subunit ribosomal protein L24
MEKLHIKTGDTVIVLSGDSKGVVGEVVATSPAEGKVIVKGANIVSKHTKARRQGETSGIVKTEGAIYASKVAIVCPKCGKAARVAHKTLENGKKIRIAAHKDCGYPEI